MTLTFPTINFEIDKSEIQHQRFYGVAINYLLLNFRHSQFITKLSDIHNLLHSYYGKISVGKIKITNLIEQKIFC